MYKVRMPRVPFSHNVMADMDEAKAEAKYVSFVAEDSACCAAALTSSWTQWHISGQNGMCIT